MNKFFYIMVLLLSSMVLSPMIVRAEDEVDDEDTVINDEPSEEIKSSGESSDDVLDDSALSSPFVKTNVLFLEPQGTDFPAGKMVKLLVGFYNNGSSSFVLDTLEGAFRYPQDYTYYIQNFSTFAVNQVVEADREATLEYFFTPSETFAARQFGLTISLRYKNLDGKEFVNAVYNETINVIEPEEGFDGETFLLYIFMAAIFVLILVGIQQLFGTFTKKGRSSKQSSSAKAAASTAQGSPDVDFEWIPKEHLQPRKSPQTSPRQRRNQRNAAAESASNDEQ